MAVPTLVQVRFNEVKISWDAVTGYQEMGRDEMVSYQVWWDQGTNTWEQLTTDSSQLLTTTYTHSISSPFLPVNQNVYYKLSGKNRVGRSILSDPLTVLTPNVPTFMNKPRATSITSHQIILEWDALNNATEWEYQGRDVITYYTIECDPATLDGTFTPLNPTGSMVTTFT